MEVEDQIIRELHQVPRQHYREILDFIRMKKKKGAVPDTALASESSLKKDWLRPEEDEAWANL
ncbi:hypothetical protein [uncultured Methanoregula sp.]|jgi:hypothetical protein|uniref:hypothetical protein n=1 Tax=uncultured Methanoregula sp. TaxID=1005933 RepID=UPI002AAA75AE|nr:hypothetical protein [uncultured Methanoregula sp.]